MNYSYLVESSKSGSTFSTTTLLLIGGVAILVILVAILLVKIQRWRSRSYNMASKRQLGIGILEIGLDHASNGNQYVITDEGNADTKNAEEQEHTM